MYKKDLALNNSYTSSLYAESMDSFDTIHPNQSTHLVTSPDSVQCPHRADVCKVFTGQQTLVSPWENIVLLCRNIFQCCPASYLNGLCKWPYNCCFVRCCIQDLSKTTHIILVKFPSSIFVKFPSSILVKFPPSIFLKL